MEQKRGEGNKDFKKGKQAGVGVLNRGGGAWNPLTNYGLMVHFP